MPMAARNKDSFNDVPSAARRQSANSTHCSKTLCPARPFWAKTRIAQMIRAARPNIRIWSGHPLIAFQAGSDLFLADRPARWIAAHGSACIAGKARSDTPRKLGYESD